MNSTLYIFIVLYQDGRRIGSRF